MKIIQINASYKPAYIYGGPALSVSRLCEGLAKSGENLEVLTTTANGPDELPVEENKQVEVDGVKVTYYKRLTKDHTHFSPALLGALREKVKGERLKGKGQRSQVQGERLEQEGRATKGLVIHIHAWWNLVSVFSCLMAKFYKVPVVLTPRGTLSSYSFGNRNASIKDYIHKYLGKGLLEYCHFHVTSEKEKEDILKLVSPKSITVIPNFVYLPELEKQEAGGKIQETGFQNQDVRSEQQEQNAEVEHLTLAENNEGQAVPFQLLFLSRVEEKKGLDILFKALAQIQFPFQLNIAGSGDKGYLESLKELAEELGISSNLSWLGQKSQEEKWKVMQEHNLLALPSHDENFANVVIECLAMGTPVLISNKVGLADYVSCKKFGWICEPEVKSVRESLELAFNDAGTASYTREIAPAEIRKDFDELRLVKEFISLYDDIVL